MKLALALVFCLSLVIAATAVRAGAEEPFAVIELFTSQGCSSCPSADELLIELADRGKTANARVYTLGFHVDYWDYLGWKDPFSRPEFTKRQNKYAKVFNATSVYTPQMVINGQKAFVGSDRSKAKRYTDIYLDIPSSNTLSLKISKYDQRYVEVSFMCDRSNTDAVIHFALVESGLKNNVTAGENQGRVLKNDNVVRAFETIPLRPEGTVVLNLPAEEIQGRLAVIAYVQNERSMRIYAANRVDFIK
jgi:hypothetical protein